MDKECDHKFPKVCATAASHAAPALRIGNCSTAFGDNESSQIHRATLFEYGSRKGIKNTHGCQTKPASPTDVEGDMLLFQQLAV
jgi:hypothetical protein